ncbi:MAG TPA: hypothetical protein VG963_32200 [Polyangiaceae bacterium]|nr:hypothetical protein [Polyangiaceae bacterium]
MPSAAARGRLFFRIRVSILLSILLVVAIYAAVDHERRRARRDWQHPLEVALVLTSQDPLEALDLDALVDLRDRIEPLESALEREFARYGGTFRPIRFRVFGPVSEPLPLPTSAEQPSLLDTLRFSLSLGRYARACDHAAVVDGAYYDGKVYARLASPVSARRAFVEGLAEDGGRIAVTSIELSRDSVDFGLFVVAHELFHLLGATDRYAADGTALLPEGLGDPDLVPLYPQNGAELMARGRVLSPGREVAPADLSELRVGVLTAREVGWLRPR